MTGLDPVTVGDGTIVTRNDGLGRLGAFLAGPGRDQARVGKTDRGPGGHSTTSVLSPHFRRRLPTEAEVVSAALDAFGETPAAKFVSEAF